MTDWQTRLDARLNAKREAREQPGEPKRCIGCDFQCLQVPARGVDMHAEAGADFTDSRRKPPGSDEVRDELQNFPLFLS
jgi:ferredoxin